MGRADPRNAIVVMLSVAVVAVFMQLIRGHKQNNESKHSLAESQKLCPHSTASQTTALQTTAPMYDLGPCDESLSQGLKLDYVLKLLYCSTPKGGKMNSAMQPLKKCTSRCRPQYVSQGRRRPRGYCFAWLAVSNGP